MQSPVPAIAAEGSQRHPVKGGVQRGVVRQVQLVVRVIRRPIRVKEMSGTCQHRQGHCKSNQAVCWYMNCGREQRDFTNWRSSPGSGTAIGSDRTRTAHVACNGEIFNVSCLTYILSDILFYII